MKAVRYRYACFIHSAIVLCAWVMPSVCSAWEAAAGHLEKSAADYTITDGVGKEVYLWVSWPDKVELYERGGVYYARCSV